MSRYRDVPIADRLRSAKRTTYGPAEVRIMVEERNDGATITFLAAKYNVSISTMRNMLYGLGPYKRD